MKGAFALLLSLLTAQCAVSTSVTLVPASDSDLPDEIVIVQPLFEEEIEFVKRNAPVGEAVHAASKTMKPMCKGVKTALKVGAGTAVGFASGVVGTLSVHHIVKSSKSSSAPVMPLPDSSPTDMGSGAPMYKRSPNVGSEVAHSAEHVVSKAGKGVPGPFKVFLGAALGMSGTAVYKVATHSHSDPATTMQKRAVPGASEVTHTAETLSKVAKPMSRHVKNAMLVGGGMAAGIMTGVLSLHKRAVPGASEVSHVVESVSKGAKPMSKNAKNAMMFGGGMAAGALTTLGLSKRAVPSEGAPQTVEAVAEPARQSQLFRTHEILLGTGGPLGDSVTVMAMRKLDKRDQEPGMLKRNAVSEGAVHAAEGAVKAAKAAKPGMHKGVKSALHVMGGAAAGIGGTLLVKHLTKKPNQPAFDASKEAPMVKRSMVTTDQSFVENSLERRSYEGQVVGKAVKSGGRQAAAMYGLAAGAIGGGLAGWHLNQAKQDLIASTTQRVLRDPSMANFPSPGDPANRMVKRAGISAQEVSPLFAGAQKLLKGPHGKKIGIAAGIGGTALVAGHVGHTMGHSQGYADGVGSVLNSGSTQTSLAKRSPVVIGEVLQPLKTLSRASSSASSSGTAAHEAISRGVNSVGAASHEAVSQGTKAVGKISNKVKAMIGGAVGTTAFVAGTVHGRHSTPPTSHVPSTQMGQGSMYRKRDVDDTELLQRREPGGLEGGITGKAGTALLTAGATGLLLGGAYAGHHIGFLQGKAQALERNRGGSSMYYKKRDVESLERRAIDGKIGTTLLTTGAAGLTLGGVYVGHHIGSLSSKVKTLESRPGMGGMYKRDTSQTILDSKNVDSATPVSSYVGLSRRPMSSSMEAMYYKRDLLDKRSPTFEKGLANTIKGVGLATGITGIAYLGHKVGKQFRPHPSPAPMAPSSGMSGGGMDSGMGMYKRDLLIDIEDDPIDDDDDDDDETASDDCLAERSPVFTGLVIGAALGGAAVHRYHSKKNRLANERSMLAQQQQERQGHNHDEYSRARDNWLNDQRSEYQRYEQENAQRQPLRQVESSETQKQISPSSSS